VHGVIHLELQKFVEAGYGHDAWLGLLKKTGLDAEVYAPIRAYPDEQIVALVAAASEATGTPAETLLEAFGEHLVPAYVGLYGSLLDPSWRTLEVIEHTEETIHRVVRRRQPGAAPPRLHIERTGPHEVVIHYDSQRRLCAVARGIARGLAKHFGETIRMEDRACMLRGDAKCLIAVRN
jgi:hypothetical protein